MFNYNDYKFIRKLTKMFFIYSEQLNL